MGLTVVLLTPGQSDGCKFPLLKQHLSHIHRGKAPQGLLKTKIPNLTCELSALQSSGRVYWRIITIRKFCPATFHQTSAAGYG